MENNMALFYVTALREDDRSSQFSDARNGKDWRIQATNARRDLEGNVINLGIQLVFNINGD